ncbi:Hypothetical predicted protein [Mytilus galloprovincialis]|uniref:Uncharacterized protein n=1 Tax=Mytilus galloprovincialis TaxID=29158 RepID=A0A8B6G956_MYTGA|nr:Hypothetical predicted protein [Mytilus galloprovincialis]
MFRGAQLIVNNNTLNCIGKLTKKDISKTTNTQLQNDVRDWFIESQQAKQRDDRRFEREREKEEWEVEKVRLEHELELKRLDSTRLFENEKHREERGNVNPLKGT